IQHPKIMQHLQSIVLPVAVVPVECLRAWGIDLVPRVICGVPGLVQLAELFVFSLQIVSVCRYATMAEAAPAANAKLVVDRIHQEAFLVSGRSHGPAKILINQTAKPLVLSTDLSSDRFP